MANNVPISQLTSATTPLDGTEVLPIVQSGTTKKVAVADVGKTELAQLNDVDLTGISDGDILKYDGNDSEFKPSANTFDALADVNLTSLTDGQFFKYDAVSQKIINTDIPNGEYLKLTNLGTSYSAELKSDISSGAFEKVKVGGYFTINSHVYYVAHLDYWLHTGDTECTTHHAVIVPASSTLVSGKMNSTNNTTGAYAGSDFKTGANSNTALADIKAIIETDFGASNILTHREIFANVVDGNGASSGWAWVDSDIDLMNETMVYGHCVCSKPGTYGHLYEVGIDKSQLELFAKRPDFITTRGNWWLRDVVDSTYFALVDRNGNAASYGASTSLGIRPAFAIC